MGSNGDLDFGVVLPSWTGQTTPEAWRRIAEAADRCGFDWVGRGEHLLFTDAEDSWGIDTTAFDAFAVLAFAAAVTEEVRIGTNVVVAPYRHPVALAKLALSLDALSRGRFELGVAPGWCRSEFEVLDVPFEERGARTDEFLALFERASAEPVVEFGGPHGRSGHRVGFYPRPVQAGGPPVLIGGFSGPAFRRVAEYGDGWTYGTDDPFDVAEARDRIARAWADYDRTGEPYLAANSGAYVGSDAPDGGGPLVGTADEVVEGVAAYADAGADRVSFSLGARTETLGEEVTQVERVAENVLPSFQ